MVFFLKEDMDCFELEDYFFGRIASKIFSIAYSYIQTAYDEKVNDFRCLHLLSASLLLILGNGLYYIFVLETKFFIFLKSGGLFLVTISIIFTCYILTTYFLGV